MANEEFKDLDDLNGFFGDADEPEEALEESYSTGLETPNLGFSRTEQAEEVVPDSFAPTPVTPSLPKPEGLGALKIPKLETGIVPDVREQMVQTPRATETPALLEQPTSAEANNQLTVQPTIETAFGAKNPADLMNELTEHQKFMFGETRETQGRPEDNYRPSWMAPVEIAGPKAFDVNDPSTWKKANKSAEQLIAEGEGLMPTQKTLMRDVLGQPVLGMAQIAGFISGGLGLIGETTGSDATVKFAKSVSESLQPVLKDLSSNVQSISDIKGAGDAVRYVASAIGPQIPLMLATWGAGIGLGKALSMGMEATGIGRAIATKAAEKAMQTGFTNRFARMAGEIAKGKVAGLAGGAITSTAMETGIIAQERMDRDNAIASLDLLWAIPAGLLDTFGYWRFAKDLGIFSQNLTDIVKNQGTAAAKSTWKKGLLGVLNKHFGLAATEAPTEAAQGVLETWGAEGQVKLNKEILSRAVNEGIAGGLAAIFMGGLANTFAVPPPKISMNDPVTGKPESVVGLPGHARTLTAWDQFRKTFIPEILQPVENIPSSLVPGTEAYLWAQHSKNFLNILKEGPLKQAAEEARFEAEKKAFAMTPLKETAEKLKAVDLEKSQKLETEKETGIAEFEAGQAGLRETMLKLKWAEQGMAAEQADRRFQLIDEISKADIREPGDIRYLSQEIQEAWDQWWEKGTGKTFDEFLDEYYSKSEREIFYSDPDDDKLANFWNNYLLGVKDKKYSMNHFGNFMNYFRMTEGVHPLMSMNEYLRFFTKEEIKGKDYILYDQNGGILINNYSYQEGGKGEFLPVEYIDPHGQHHYGDDIVKALTSPIQQWMNRREAALELKRWAAPPPQLAYKGKELPSTEVKKREPSREEKLAVMKEFQARARRANSVTVEPVEERKLSPLEEEMERAEREAKAQAEAGETAADKAARENVIPKSRARKIIGTVDFKYDRFGERRYADSVEITATDKGQKVGSVNFVISKPPKNSGQQASIKIEEIEVEEGYRRRGIATELIEQIKAKHPGIPIYTNFQTELGQDFFKSLGIGRTAEAYTGGVIPPESQARKNTTKMYSTSGAMTWGEMVDTEVEDRGNYTPEDVAKWKKQYNVGKNDKVIWVATTKERAASYQYSTEEIDSGVVPDTSDVGEYDARKGDIIQESDDGDDGYLLILRGSDEIQGIFNAQDLLNLKPGSWITGRNSKIKPWLTLKQFTGPANEYGKMLSKVEAQKFLSEYKRASQIRRRGDYESPYRAQFLREVVEGFLGTQKAMTLQQIEQEMQKSEAEIFANREEFALARARRLPGFAPATIALMKDGSVGVYINGEIHGQNLTDEQLGNVLPEGPGTRPSLIKGWIDAATDTFFPSELYSLKVDGVEGIVGISREEIEQQQAEGFYSKFWDRVLPSQTRRRAGLYARLGAGITGDKVIWRDPKTGQEFRGQAGEIVDGKIQVRLDNGNIVLGEFGTVRPVAAEATQKLVQGDTARVLKDKGKSVGYFNVLFFDGHVEPNIKADSEYKAKQLAKERYKASQPQTATLSTDAVEVASNRDSARLAEIEKRMVREGGDEESDARRIIEGGLARINKDQAQQVVNEFALKIPRGVANMQVYSTWDDIPPELQDKLLADGVKPEDAAFWNAEVKIIGIIAENHPSQGEVAKSLFHELITHVGMERIFGPAKMMWVVNEIHRLFPEGQLDYIYKAYNLDPGKMVGRYTAGVEKLAEISETFEQPSLWRRFVAWAKEQIYDITGGRYKMKLTSGDIKAYLWRSRNIIQSEEAYNRAVEYNLARQNGGPGELPVGPLKIAAKKFMNPSHLSAPENEAGWRAYYEARKNKDKNFHKQMMNDLGMLEAAGSLPFWIAMGHPEFAPVTEVEWERADKRHKDYLSLVRSVFTNTGDNEYLGLKDTSAVDHLIVWSDYNDYYLKNEDELQKWARELVKRNLTPEEIKAYHAWKKAMDNAADYAIKKIKDISLGIYKDRVWYGTLTSAIKGEITLEQAQASLPPDQVQEFNMAYASTRVKWDNADDREAQMKKLNFYAPHIRGKGDFVVRVFETDVNAITEENPEGKVAIWVERFDSKTSAEKGRMRIAQVFKDAKAIEKTYEPKIDEFVYGGGFYYPRMEAIFGKALVNLEMHKKISEDESTMLFDSVFAEIDKIIAARGFRQHYIRRHRGAEGEMILGYQTKDMKKVFNDYMSGLAGSMSKMEATYDFHRALKGIDRVNQKELHKYAAKYIADMLRNEDSLTRKLNAYKTIPYAWYLTMNLRLAVTQMFQNAVTAYPILSRLQQEAGVKGGAHVRLASAIKDVFAGLRSNFKNLSEEEQGVLTKAYQEGETMALAIKAMKGNIEKGWAKKYFMKVLDVASIPFAGMEKINRQSSLLAAYRMYKEAGRSPEKAYSEAKNFVRMAHYAYGLSNFPQLLRDDTPWSKVGAMGYVFKSFPHNYVLSMLHFARNKEGKLALGVMMRSIAVLALLGGLTSVPFLDDLLEAYEKLTGHFVRSEVRSTLKKYGGPMLADVGMEGLPALAGIDMSGSVKMQLPLPGITDWDPNTFAMGVWGGLLDKGRKAVQFAADGDFGRMAESLAPVGIELPLQAIRRSREGLRTAQGKEILNEKGQPIKPTTYQTAMQVGSFRPHAISKVQKERRVAQNALQHYSEVRAEMRKDLRMAMSKGDIKELDKIRTRIQKYNMEVMKYRGVVPRFGGIRETMRPEMGYMKTKRLLYPEEE